jgi:hypothetical protein
MASFLLLPILPVFRGRHGYRPAFVVSSKALTRHSRVQAALSGSSAGRPGKLRGGIQNRRRTVIACLQRIARLFGWRAGQSPLAAEADLRFGAAVELGISDFIPSSRTP